VRPDWIIEFHQSVQRNENQLDEVQSDEALVGSLDRPSLFHPNKEQFFQDRYEISDRLLGSGMFSKVYLASDVTTKRQLACKIVDLRATVPASGHTAREITTSREDRERLIREVDLLTRLNHVW
jgi:hypothetical protein